MYGNSITINAHYGTDGKRVLPCGQTRLLKDIAKEIQADIADKSWYIYAKDYVEALAQLETITDEYYADSAASVVSYLLANLTSWRGEKARAIKAELNAIKNAYYKEKQ